MRPDPKLEQLRAAPGLQRQSNAALRALAGLSGELDLSPGQLLTREGVTSQQAFVIVTGEADMFVDGEAIGCFGPGDIVGSMTGFESRPSSATVRARTPMRVLVIGPEAVSAFTEQTRSTASTLE